MIRMDRWTGWMRVVAVMAGYLLLQAGWTGLALADEQVPEIDPGSMSSALTLLCGGLLILTGRRRRS
jgi:hypothetical protein